MRFRALSIIFCLLSVLFPLCQTSHASAIGCTEIVAWLGAGVSSHRIAEVVQGKHLSVGDSVDVVSVLHRAGATPN